MHPVKQALASVCVMVLVVGCAQTIRTSPTVEKWEQGTSFDSLFPIENDSILGVVAWKDFATDPEQQEFYLSISEKSSAGASETTLEAVVKIAVQPLQMQLGPQVKIWRWSLSESSCPAIREVVDEFTDVQRPGLPRNPETGEAMHIHPWIHQVFFREGWAETSIKVYGVDHPLAKWVGGVRASLNACMNKGDDAT